MKRTSLMRAAALLTVIALTLGLAGVAVASTKEPIDVDGDPKESTTTWNCVYKESKGDYFYKGTAKYRMSGHKALCSDVAEWNGVIRWKKIKAAGMKYAIIRCGYGRNVPEFDDKQWDRNAKYAKKYGIKMGVYLYSYASNEAYAYSEAQHTLRCLKEAGLNPEDLALHVYYDI